MFNWLIKLLTGPEQFWPGQRVQLANNYPADIAEAAQRQFIHGTVHSTRTQAPYNGDVLVLWDGYPKLRYMRPDNLSSRVLESVTFPNDFEQRNVQCICSARSENECVC